MSAMKQARIVLIAVALASGCGDRVSNLTGGGGPTQRSITVALGKHVVIPTHPLDQALIWRNTSGIRTGYVSPKGTYHAPITLPSPPTVILEGSRAGRTEVVAVQLESGLISTEDCKAPGQPDPRDPANASIPVEELPESIVRVPPSYPDAAREAGVSGTVVLRALVCACGEIMDLSIVNSIPMLDQAAVVAVRQWYFRPATNDGEPVATWVTIPVKFSLH